MSSFAPLIKRPAPTPVVMPPKPSLPTRGRSAAPLPYVERLQRAFGRDHNLGTIRAYSGAAATAAGGAIGARAYTRGSDIVFAEPPTLERAAHEAAHVVQQRAGAATDGMSDGQRDSLERHAELVGARVRTGRMAEDLLAPYLPLRSPAIALQRDAVPGAPRIDPAGAGVVQAVLSALAKPDEVAGVGDLQAAFAALAPLPTDQLLSVLAELDRRGSLDLLLDNEASALALADGARIVGAMRAVHASRPGAANMTQEQLVSDAQQIGGLSGADLNAVMQYLTRLLPTVAAEGMLAMSMMTSTAPLLPGAVAAAGGGSVAPNPFAPPGNQPIPFYIGNSAHDQIAAAYIAAHVTDVIRANNIAVSTILNDLAKLGKANTPSAVDPSDLGLEPDITNLTKLHLYEIKPQAMRSVAEAESKMYMALFVTAGLPMRLGPSTEPGTAGIVPAPGGYYAFESPEPGVILYQYRKGQYEPVPVPVESPQPEAQNDFLKKMSALTGLTGVALIIYIIISEGSRVAFPPRNAIPAP